MTARHVFLQYASGPVLITRDRRGGAEIAASGRVEEARYLTGEVETRPPGGAGWWPRFLRWWRSGPEGGIGVPALGFALPFDAQGGDVLGLIDPATDTLDGTDDPLGSIRRIEGTVVCLSPRQPGDRVVLRDAWITDAPIWRVVDGVDFAVLARDAPPVAVCCAMAPLLIGPPETRTVDEHLAYLADVGAREMVTSVAHARGADEARCVEIREGDRVEVVGVVSEPRSAVTRFDVLGRSAPYRGDARLLSLIIGDEPGTRLVVRKLPSTAPSAASR